MCRRRWGSSWASGAVAITGWERLDAIVALAVAVNIVVIGLGLVRRSAGGLMDRSLSPAELGSINGVLDTFRSEGVDFHALRTRPAGSRAFIANHILIPGAWTVQQGHDVAERVEDGLRAKL